MSWQELRLVVSTGRKERWSAALHDAGAAGVQEDWLPGEAPAPRQPWDTGPAAPEPERALLRGWFEAPDEAAITASLATLIASDPHCGGAEWAPVEEVDWEASWRESFQPLRISERLVVCPPWQPEPGALLIEPGRGFGTGDHPTTRLALHAVDRLVQPGQTVLDVGAGSGILALAAAKFGARAFGIDIDPEAVRDAIEQAERNGLEVPFDTTPLAEVEGTWDLVLANVHAEMLVRLADDLVARTGDLLVLGGILADREHLVHEAFDHRLNLIERFTDEDWVGLTYQVQ